MIVLGLWDGHDAGAALVAGGRLVCAISEERLSRVKRASGFPTRAIRAVLDDAGVQGHEVTHVALAGRAGRLPQRVLDSLYGSSSPDRDPLAWSSTVARLLDNHVAKSPALASLEAAAWRPLVRSRLEAHGLGGANLCLVDHHDAHAATAGLVTTSEGAALVTMDGYGDGDAATFRQSGRVTRLRSPGASLALIYGATTRLLGFREGDEGKVTGLAARGDPGRLGAAFRAVTAPGACAPSLSPELRAAIRSAPREDVAAAVQTVVEERALELFRQHVVGSPPLAVAGGLFANVALNQRIAQRYPALSVFPAMGDAGLCVGAAVVVAGPVPFGVPFLGPEPASSEVEAAVKACGLPAVGVGRPEWHLADAILRGATVARVVGRSEFGPRALGHRSILMLADDASRLETLNRALARDDFMPFAPIRRGGAGTATMTQLFEADAALRERCPAVVHVDGTVRTQRLDAAADPALAELLQRTEAAGHPALVNTSFNLHGEPIVESAVDALRTFERAGLDLMQLSGWLVAREARWLPGNEG